MKVAVIGGGVSGLAAAVALQEGGAEVRLFEASARVGGAIRTESVGGYVFEEGAVAVDAPAPAFRRFAAMLGIEDRLLDSAPAHTARLLYHHGHLVPLPTDLWGFLKTPVFSAWQKLRAFAEPFLPQARVSRDVSLAEFFGRRVGRAISATWVDVVAGHIFAGHPNRLGIRGAFPEFFAQVTKDGGVLRAFVRAERASAAMGSSGVLSLPGGLGELVQRAEERLGERLLREHRAVGLARAAAGFRLSFATPSGAAHFEADRVVLATPARTTAMLIAPMLPTVADLLFEIESSSVVTAICAARVKEIPGIPAGRDFHAARSTRLRTLGWTFTSNLFPSHAGEGRVVLNGLLGGLLDKTAVHQKESVLKHLFLGELALALSQRRIPRVDTLRVVPWPQAIPQYQVGHLQRMAAVRTLTASDAADLHLAGNYVSGVLIDDCVRESLSVADAILAAGSPR